MTRPVLGTIAARMREAIECLLALTDAWRWH